MLVTCVLCLVWQIYGCGFTCFLMGGRVSVGGVIVQPANTGLLEYIINLILKVALNEYCHMIHPSKSFYKPSYDRHIMVSLHCNYYFLTVHEISMNRL